MTQDFTQLVTGALEECAPITKFKINPDYRHGITKETKELTRERDSLRKELKRSPNEKKTQNSRYKNLRNRITNEIRRYRIRQNRERIKKCKAGR